MGMRIIAKTWETRYIGSTAVHQEVVESWSSLFNQRTRWAWGTLQALAQHVVNLKIWKANISVRKKIDSTIYLVHIMVPSMVLLCWIISSLSMFGIATIHNAFPVGFTLANAFSFFPLVGYGLWRERSEYSLWKMIPLLFIVTVYTYHWIPCTIAAGVKILTAKPTWSKTPRFSACIA